MALICCRLRWTSYAHPAATCTPPQDPLNLDLERLLLDALRSHANALVKAIYRRALDHGPMAAVYDIDGGDVQLVEEGAPVDLSCSISCPIIDRTVFRLCCRPQSLISGLCRSAYMAPSTSRSSLIHARVGLSCATRTRL